MLPTTRGVCAVLVFGLSGCLMSADESRWHDSGQEGDIAVVDHLIAIDHPGSDALADSGLDARPDAAPLDGPDATPLDSVPPDVSAADMACPQVVLNISGPADDGIIWGTDLHVDGGPDNKIWIGYWDGESEWGYFRFALTQPIPQGAVVGSAKLDLHGVDTDGWISSSHALEVWVEKAADPAAVAAGTEAPLTATGRPVTTSAKRWPAVGGLPWTKGGYNTTPDLSALVQEVVNSQGGLAMGSHIQLWVRGSQQAQADLSTPDYKRPGYVATPARLTLSWCQ